MTTEKKYTLPEAALGIGIIGALVPVVLAVVAIPIGAFQAWLRMTIWNWFHSYFGLPAVGFWPMFALGLIVSSWRASSSRSLKEEFYKGSWSSYFFGEILADLLGLGIAFLIHVFILTH
jgi:hypothetical protein